jgi:SAM-dependent methyltransferase
MLTAEEARSWLDRWDRQQAGFMVDRERRFQLMFDALEAITGGGQLTVLDLGCGPGSLSVRLLDRLPAARVVAVDVDPVLLALGRAAHAGRDRLRFVTADLRDAGWAEGLDLDGRVDGVLSTTALHWLSRPQLGRLYADLAGLVRPGGALLDGDRRHFGPEERRLAAAADEMTGRNRRDPGVETWEAWWAAVRAVPDLAPLVAERDRMTHAGHHGRHDLLDDDHRTMLRAAGFAEANTLWQHGAERILVAVR